MQSDILKTNYMRLFVRKRRIQLSRPAVFGGLVSHLRVGCRVLWRRYEIEGPGRAIGLELLSGGGLPGGGGFVPKFILALLTACLFVTGSAAWGQVSLVQVVSCGRGTFPGTSCPISATKNGDLIVIAWQSDGEDMTNTMSSVTDNVANTYVEAGGARSIDTNETNWNDIWYAKNSKAGATCITVTPSASDSGGVVIWEFSGADPNSPVDQTATLNSQAGSATPIGAPVTITAPNEVIVSIVDLAYNASAIASGNPFMSDSNLLENGWAHYITSSAGTYSAQWTQNNSGTYGSSTVSFKAAGTKSPCDLNADGIVDMQDVHDATTEAMGLSNAPACQAPQGFCTLAYVQAVLANAMGGGCILPVIDGPGSISFGNVNVGGNSTRTVTLSGSGLSGTTITQANVSSTGFSIRGLTLPLTIPVGQNASFSVIFSPTSAVSFSGSIAFVSNALNPLNETLTGTGVASAPHSVTLTWSPSSTSGATYNVYRSAPTTSSTNQPTMPYSPALATNVGACSGTPVQCTYTDTNNLVSGDTYWYYVTAVAGGVESSPSNVYPGTIP